jgi:hypothetical protein
MRRALFIFLWMIIFYLVASVLAGFISGAFFGMASPNPVPPNATTKMVSTIWKEVVGFSGSLGLILGFLGLLPGTKKEPKP